MKSWIGLMLNGFKSKNYTFQACEISKINFEFFKQLDKSEWRIRVDALLSEEIF